MMRLRLWVMTALALTVPALAGSIGGASAAAQAGPPEARPGGPYAGAINAPITFGAGDSTGINLTFTWDFGDGTTSSGVITTKVYGAAGVFPVRLTVTDQAGQTASAATAASIGIAGGPLVDTAAPCENTGGGLVCGFLPPSCTLTAYGPVCWTVPPVIPSAPVVPVTPISPVIPLTSIIPTLPVPTIIPLNP